MHLSDGGELRTDASACGVVLGGLEAFGATLALIWVLAVPHPANADVAAVAGCVAGAYAIAAFLWTKRRVSFRVIEALLTFTVVVLISGALHFAGPGGGAFALFYLLAALFAFAFIAPWRAVLQGCLIAICYGAVLLGASSQAHTGADITRWLFMVGVVFCAGGLLLALGEALRRGERRFRNGLEASPIGAGLVDSSGALVYMNPSLRALLGLPGGLHRPTLGAFLDEPQREQLARALGGASEGQKTCVQFDATLSTPLAPSVVITVSQVPEREPLHTLVQVRDVSDRVRANALSRHLAAIVQSSDDAIFTKDLDGVVLTWNRGAERLYGYSAQEMIGNNISTIIPVDRRPEARAVIERIRRGEHVPAFETLRRHRSGHLLNVSISVSPLRDRDEQLLSVAVVARDITEPRRMEKALALNERRYRQLFERNPHPMWVYDEETLRFLAVNERAISSYGYTRDEFLAMTIEDIRPVEDHTRLRRSLADERASLAEGDIWRHRKKSGAVIDVEVLADDFDFDGVPARLVVAIDVSARLEAERQLRHLADHDALTGVFSRGRLESEIDAVLRGSAPGQCAVAVLDVDHLKFINDSVGHAGGDEVLRQMARSLTSALEPGQAVGRLGGDEFVVLMPDSDEERAYASVSRLLAEIKECLSEGGHKTTASAGIAVSPRGQSVSAEDLLVAADIALYEAKDAGRDRCAMAGGVGRGQTWIDQIGAALLEDRFVLHAQPIIELGSGRVVREELLIRMVGEDGDLIPPASFIPASERFGLINQIDRWVVARAIELAAAGRCVEVNLSAHSLGDHEITRSVADAVRKGMNPDNLVFEITETAAAANYRAAAEFAERLSRIGCGFALDDFGTGFGTLTYLKHIPFSYLKIDQEFVRGITREPQSQRIVRVIVKTALELGQKTIAEGVETADALSVLRDLGVHYAQGYHIARPGPIEESSRSRTSAASQAG